MARCACGPPTAEHWRRRCRVAQGQRVAQGRRFEESEGAEAQRIAQAGRRGAGRGLAQARDSLGFRSGTRDSRVEGSEKKILPTCNSRKNCCSAFVDAGFLTPLSPAVDKGLALEGLTCRRRGHDIGA